MQRCLNVPVCSVCLLLACLLSCCLASNDVTPTVTTCLLCLSVLLFPFLPICLSGCLLVYLRLGPPKTFHISKVLFFLHLEQKVSLHLTLRLNRWGRVEERDVGSSRLPYLPLFFIPLSSPPPRCHFHLFTRPPSYHRLSF